MPMSMVGGERRGVKTLDPALRRVEWGGQGLDPRHLLSPPITRPTPGHTSSPGRQMGWLPQHQLPGAAVKEPLQMSGPQGKGPGGRLGHVS